MLRKTIVALCTIAMLAATFAAMATVPAQAQGDTGLRLTSEFLVPGSRFVKGPQVVAGFNQVHVSGNAERRDSNVWSKAANATTFPSPFKVANAEADGKPDWSATAVALGPDGSLYYAWIDMPNRAVNLRVRDPQGAWGPTRRVDGGAFPYPVQVAVSTTGQVFVAWRDTDRPIRFRTTLDRGVTWSSRQDVVDVVAFNSPPAFAAGPNGRMAVTFVAGVADRLQVFVGVWNGTRFVTNQITPGGADYADASLTYTPDGKLYAAWRGVAEGGGNAGAFFSEQQPDGSWPRSRLIGGKVVGTVNVDSDEAGNLHVSWVGAPSGDSSVYYAFKPASGPFRGPIGSSDTGAIYNPDGSASLAVNAYNHTVSEEFNGSIVYTRYSLFAADAVDFGGQPVVADGAARVAPATDGTVKLTFRSLTGSPTQVRWRWGAAPTDAASDSNGWQTLASEMRLPVPEAIRNSTTCQPTTLYTQLRNATTTENQARSVAVNIDGIVEAQSYLDNPFTRGAAQITGLAGIEGAPGGAPNYTRVPLTWLNVISESDCSGITVAGVGPSADKIEQNFVINDGAFGGLVSLPNLAALKPGPVPFVVRIVDGAGNVRLYNLEVILDETKPVLNAATVTASGSPDGDLIQVLNFQNVSVTDTQYPGGFWGIWIANAPEPVADPLNDSSLKWTVLEAPDERPGDDFVIDDWSLATGLAKEQLVAGEDYVIYIRFIDGAGNPTDGFVTVPVASSNVVRPETNLPTIRR